MGERVTASKKKGNEEMRKRQCRMKRKETLLPNLLQVRKTANEFSPLSNPLFLSGDIFSSSFPGSISARTNISEHARCHYVLQCFNPNDTMVWNHVPSPSRLWHQFVYTLSSYIQDFFFNPVAKFELMCLCVTRYRGGVLWKIKSIPNSTIQLGTLEKYYEWSN